MHVGYFNTILEDFPQYYKSKEHNYKCNEPISSVYGSKELIGV